MRSPRRGLTPLARCLVTVSAIAIAIAGCNTTKGGSRSASRALDVDTTNGQTLPFPVKDTNKLNVVATITGVSGDWMCFGYGSLWVPSGGHIARIDPSSHSVVAQIPAAGNFCYAAPSGNALWVSSVYDGKLSRIDPTTNTVVASYTLPPTSSSEGSFAVTDGGVWLVTSDGGTNSGTLTKVDPNSGQILAEITVADDSHGIAAQGNFVWVTSATGNSVTQVNATTNTIVRTIPVDPGPRFIASGEGGIWALSQGTGTVAHIDPTSGALIAEINAYTPGGGGDIAAGEGSVWVATFGKPVTQINPQTNTVVQAFSGGGFGDAVRAGGGFIWVSGGSIHQIHP